nr:DivIVA domain-containing protein [Mycobacterium tuberculosis]
MTTAHNGSAPRFQRTRSGYDPVAVNHYIAELVLRQQAQHCEIETLKAEIASLKDENAALKDTSPSAQAVTDRMAKMLRLAVDEVFQMQSEARAEAATLVSAARDEAEAVRTQKREMLADMNARQRALESEHADVMRRAREELNSLWRRQPPRWSGCVSSMPDAVRKPSRNLMPKSSGFAPMPNFRSTISCRPHSRSVRSGLAKPKSRPIDGCMLPTSRLSTASARLGERWKRSASGESASSNN